MIELIKIDRKWENDTSHICDGIDNISCVALAKFFVNNNGKHKFLCPIHMLIKISDWGIE